MVLNIPENYKTIKLLFISLSPPIFGSMPIKVSFIVQAECKQIHYCDTFPNPNTLVFFYYLCLSLMDSSVIIIVVSVFICLKFHVL